MRRAHRKSKGGSRFFQDAKKIFWEFKYLILGLFLLPVVLLFVFKASYSDYHFPGRTPEEVKYLKELRKRYIKPSRKLNAEQVANVVERACRFIDNSVNKSGVYFDDNALALLMGTAAIESDFMPRFQPYGEAIGLFQVEYGTYKDLWQRAIKIKYPKLRRAILKRYGNASGDLTFEALQVHDELCAVFARIKYMEFKDPLPKANDVWGQATYYKRIYNTENGAAKPRDYIRKFNKYVKPFFDKRR